MFENDGKINRQELLLDGINNEDNNSVFSNNNDDDDDDDNNNNNNNVQQILGCILLRKQKCVEFAIRNVKLAFKL
jgi:hypothetical protein